MTGSPRVPEEWLGRGDVEIEGVRIPFANARLLWLTKNTLRDKDKVDRAFLAQLPAARGESVE